MMDTQGQIYIFLIYVGMGFACGIVYEVFALIRLFCGCQTGKRVYIGGIIDVCFWVSIFICTLVCAYALKLPTVRLYTWLGFALGGIIYLKILRRTVAFLENLCYNKYVGLSKKAKRRKSTRKKVDEEI